MSHGMVGKLIWKELSLNRMLILGAAAAGLFAVGLALLGRVAFAAGGIMFITVTIAYGVTLPMLTIMGERKEKSRLFVLSLPISRGQYIWAKVVGVALSFLGPWALMLAAALALILATPIPDGMVVYTTLLMGFALADFAVIVCAAMLVEREGLMAFVIIFMNMSLTFFMVGVSALTRIGRDNTVDAVNWSSPAFEILGAELLVMLAAFAVLFWVTGREPEVL